MRCLTVELYLQLVDLVLRSDRVVGEVRHDFCPAAGAESPGRGALRDRHTLQGHDGGAESRISSDRPLDSHHTTPNIKTATQNK